MYLPILATAEAKSMAPKTYIRGGGAKDWIKTATSSIRRWPRGPKWIVPVRPPSSMPRAASTTALSRSSLPAVPGWSPGGARGPPPTAQPPPEGLVGGEAGGRGPGLAFLGGPPPPREAGGLAAPATHGADHL